MNELVLHIILYAFLAVGLFDVYLTVKGKSSLSKRVEGLFPRGVDVVIVVALLALSWWKGEWFMDRLMIAGEGASYFIHALFWTLVGHMLLGHELYKKFHSED